MKIQTSYIEVQKTARYATYGNISKNTKYFWFVLHGSHMQCDQVLYKFKDFNPDEHLIVAPEGLSRFYEKGFSGHVVSTWMTSRDRKHEIQDFVVYLSKLYQLWVDKLPNQCKRLLMGFSQGGTSMFRWLHADAIQYDFCIGYSCWIPEDINLKEAKSRIVDSPIIYTYGLQDQFLTEKSMQHVKSIIDRNELSVIMECYKGDHRIEKDQLQKLFEQHIK